MSPVSKPTEILLDQSTFLRMLRREQRRTERSGRQCIVMLVDVGMLVKADEQATPLPQLLERMTQRFRGTDLIGWYRERDIIGVIFTEFGEADDRSSLVAVLSAKATEILHGFLNLEQINGIRLAFHLFPEDWDEGSETPSKLFLQVALSRWNQDKRGSLAIKRLIDIFGSISGLTLLPVFLMIAIGIKLTSRGPVLFRQVRLGQYGKKFTFLKFRSMRVSDDYRVHEAYVKQLIAGSVVGSAGGSALYKFAADPRITPFGRFLRRWSLDELPQLLNVLLGQMSLVGPRPPVVYEFNRYDLWHRRRLLAVKPGMTGLWQVDGRSRVKFDEMVRLDIRYARYWSLWLDIKIFLRTPRAVISGNGAC
jgi:lipopolysaccharide/colanic/teichoic acid biosynthesis glycosyltransferase